MKHIYDIGYGSPEDSSYEQWYHDCGYTNEELLNIVIQGMKAALMDWRVERIKFLIELNEKIDEEDLHPRITDLIQHERFYQFLKERGFYRVQMEATVSLFGWAKADVPDSWNSYTSTGDPTRITQEALSQVPIPRELSGLVNEK